MRKGLSLCSGESSTLVSGTCRVPLLRGVQRALAGRRVKSGSPDVAAQDRVRGAGGGGGWVVSPGLPRKKVSLVLQEGTLMGSPLWGLVSHGPGSDGVETGPVEGRVLAEAQGGPDRVYLPGLVVIAFCFIFQSFDAGKGGRWVRDSAEEGRRGGACHQPGRRPGRPHEAGSPGAPVSGAGCPRPAEDLGQLTFGTIAPEYWTRAQPGLPWAP